MQNPVQLAEEKIYKWLMRWKKFPEDSEYLVMTTAFTLTEDNVI